MSAIRLSWSCFECGNGAEIRNVEKLAEQAAGHQCDAFRLIYRAAEHYRNRVSVTDRVVARLLDSVVQDLLATGHKGRDSFDACAEPSLAKWALEIADALNEVPF